MSASAMRFREPVKKHIMEALIVMLGVTSLFFCGIFSLGVDAVEGFAIVIILTGFAAWFLICSGDTFFVSIFNFLTFVNIYIFISYTSDVFAIHESGVAYMIEYILLRTSIYGVIIPLMFKFIGPRIRRLVHLLNKEWATATLVPLLFLILQIVLLYYPTPYWYWDRSSWYKIVTIIVYLLFLAVYYLLYIQANAIVEKYSLEKRQLLMAQQDKLWESELARQKMAVVLASHQKHDFHHYNAAIMEMVQIGDLDGLKDYMKSFDAALDIHNANVFCTNPIANSIFNAYEHRAEVEGIKMTFRISVPEGIVMNNIDLTCVLGNTLENALEGCLRLPKEDKKEIIVIAKFSDNRLRLQVENTCRADIVFDREIPVKQKKGGGSGIKSILYTAERYDGTARFSVKDGKFITQIVLNIN